MIGALNYDDLIEELGSAQFPDLRPAQSETLSLYESRYTEVSDNAIGSLKSQLKRRSVQNEILNSQRQKMLYGENIYVSFYSHCGYTPR
jgi:hypothetical protein